MTPTETALLVLLLLALLALLLRPLLALLAFIHTYTLHRSTLPSYLHSARSYALITGASDGIGAALARELYVLGFNLVLHGRNEAKLARVRDELLALPAPAAGPPRDVRLWVQDAAERDIDWPAVGQLLDGLEITVLVNNVGGSPIESEPFDAQPLAYVDQVVQLNALFPFHVTHLLLPRLRSLSRPTLILTTGSLAGEFPPPHFAAYAASKSFLERFINALDYDERLLVRGSQVRFHYLQTGSVKNNTGIIKRTGWGTPDARAYARGAVRLVGVRRRKVFPWPMHAVMAWLMGVIGEGLAERAMLKAMEDVVKDE